MYASYELTQISIVTRNTGAHSVDIIYICPWKICPAMLHIYVLVNCHCRLHIDTILVHTQLEKLKKKKKLIYLPCCCHMFQQQIFPPPKCHIYGSCAITQCASMLIYMVHQKSWQQKLSVWWDTDRHRDRWRTYNCISWFTISAKQVLHMSIYLSNILCHCK